MPDDLMTDCFLKVLCKTGPHKWEFLKWGNGYGLLLTDFISLENDER